MLNRFIRTSAFALCAALAVPALAQTAQTTTNRLDEIIARGTLRVGTTGDYKPFSFTPSARASCSPISTSRPMKRPSAGFL